MVGVRVEDVQTEKALALWLNSSLGILTILAHRTSTRGGWVGMKKADLEELPVLDTRKLTPAQLKGLSDLFDEMAERSSSACRVWWTARPGKPWTLAFPASWVYRI